LKPRAKRNGISLRGPLLLDVSVTSPPVDNKANGHLIKLLADALKVSRSSISLIKGEHCRGKVVAVEGISGQEAGERLAGYAEGRKR
ncbi:MAG: DUF167 domain-containing protein, partial [Fibrobacterota bacterium]